MEAKRINEPVLVTGGAGFIGGHIVAQLADAGLEVRLLDTRPPKTKLPGNVKVITGSILDTDILARVMAGASTVFHCAANAALWARDKSVFDKINFEGTARVLDAAASVNVERIVVTSTETILKGWNDASDKTISEDLPLTPYEAMAGPYTRSKWKAEQRVKEAAGSGIPVVTVYPTLPIGSGDRMFTGPTAMIRDFAKGATPAYLEVTFNYVGVEDIARGHILAAAKGEPGEGYILGGANMGFREFLDLLEKVSGREMPTRKVPYVVARAVSSLSEFAAGFTGQAPKATIEGVRLAKYSSAVSIHKARSQLGYAPGNLEAALSKAVNWLKAEGHLQ